jgi:branched-chain amino acid transport system permease protein
MHPRTLAALAVVLIMAISLPFFADVFYTRLATQVAIYGLVALSVDLLVGYAGLLTFGQAALFGTGAYVAGLLTAHGLSSALVVWPLTMLATGFCALIIGALALRTSGFQFIMVTLAFAQMIYYFWQSQRRLGGENGFSLPHRDTLPFLNLENQVQFYYVCLAILVLIVVVARRLTVSRFGMVIQGVRENERRVVALGFPAYPYKLVLFSISGGIAGLAGALMANHTSHVGTDLLGWQQSGNFLAMVILGSTGTLTGPILGAAIFTIFAQIVSDATDHWLFYFGLLIVLRILLFKGNLFDVLAPVFAPRRSVARPSETSAGRISLGTEAH